MSLDLPWETVFGFDGEIGGATLALGLSGKDDVGGRRGVNVHAILNARHGEGW